MKLKVLLFLGCCSISIHLKAQDFLKSNQIYLTVNNRNIKFDDIDPHTILKLLGNPLKIKKEFSETADGIVVSYIYKGGTIDFEKSTIAFIEIEKPGWGFTFYKNGKFTPDFTVGTEASSIKQYFPYSLLKKGESFIRIGLKTIDNIEVEEAVIFEIKAGKVKSVSFFTDES